MLKQLMRAIILVSPLLATYVHAELLEDGLDTESPENEIIINGLDMSPENPLSKYALKKNGKVRKRFNINYSTLADYYAYVGQGSIVENKNPQPLMDLDLNVMKDRKAGSLKFRVDFGRRKVYPLELVNPHSISHLFVVNPKLYIEQTEQQDFLSAKRAIYKDFNFNTKKLRYDRNMVHLEDWRSLNHPPVNDLGDDLTIWDKFYSPIDYSKQQSVFHREDFQKKVDEISNTELTFGNKLELLANGESYAKKKNEILNAKKSVLMAVMSFFCDNSSVELEEILIQKAKEGVDVKLMVEKVWTKAAMKKCMRRMVKGGVDVVYANDLLKKGEESALFHNKFMIIDNKIVIMGGSNIVESDNISTGFNHMNRDNDVYIEGPIATDAVLNFVSLWKKFETQRNEKNQEKSSSVKDITHYEKIALAQKDEERTKGLRGVDYYSTKLNDPATRNNGVCRFMTQSPDTDKHKLTKVFMEYISNAEKNLNMTTGSIFFTLPTDDAKEKERVTWNKRLFETIFSATERGIKLDIIGNGIDGGYGELSNMINRLNHKNRFHFKPIAKTLYSIMTSWLDKGAAKKNAPYMEYIQTRPNARAWQNFQYMHSKLIQVDRTVNIISSYNLEEWSGDKSHEGAVICMDEKLSGEMDRSFVRDFVNSVPALLKQ